MRLSRGVCVSLFAIMALTASGCSSPADKEAKYLKRGSAYLKQKEFDKARIEYRNAMRIAPTDPEVFYRVGLLDEAEGELRNAFVDFNHAIEQNERFAPALLKVAQYYVAAGQTEEAETRVRTVLADNADDPEANGLDAAIKLRNGQDDEAEKQARFALAKDPANITAVSVLTGLYVKRQEVAKVDETLTQGIQRNPTAIELLQLKIAANQKLGNSAKIVEAYEALFKLAPEVKQYRLDLANLYVQQNQLDQGEAVLRDGVEAAPSDWGMKKLLVNYLSEHRDLQAAEAQIRKYMAAYPSNDDLYFWLADLYTSHKDVDRAISLLQEVVAKDRFEQPGLNARTSLAQISFARGDRDLASRLVAVVLEKEPDNPDALYLRAGMAFDSGLYRSSVADLRTILRDKPKSKEALQLLAEALVRQGHADLAIDTLSQLVDIDPLNPATRVRLAQMHHLNGDSKQALDILSVVTKANSTYPVGWESTARICIDMKDWAGAEVAIAKLAPLEGQAMTAKFLKGQVAQGNGKIEEAVKLYAEVITADPSAPLAEHALGVYVMALRQANHLDVAAHFMETLKTDSPNVALTLGEVYAEEGNTPAAIKIFDQLVASKMPRPEPYIDRAQAAIREHDMPMAIETLRRGVAAVPGDTKMALALADMLGANGKYDEAISIYDSLLNRDPGLDVAANNMAELIADYQSEDRVALDKARRMADRFLGSTNPILLDTVGWVYFRQGNMQQALTLFERAVSSGADVPPQVHYHLGLALLKNNQKELAKVQFQQAVRGNRVYPGIEEAKKILETL